MIPLETVLRDDGGGYDDGDAKFEAAVKWIASNWFYFNFLFGRSSFMT